MVRVTHLKSPNSLKARIKELPLKNMPPTKVEVQGRSQSKCDGKRKIEESRKAPPPTRARMESTERMEILPISAAPILDDKLII